MALNNVMAFAITPSEPIQMILGTNGSGKSSLMAELTPLPADPSGYYSDGSKTIEITHRGSFYKLVNNFAVSKVHSFEKDGEELNPGGGVTIQRELVKQHFGITEEIRDLLIGLEKFHNMPPSRRRVWFTRLSDVSYDYALAVFQRMAERSRDLSGALKLQKKRLVSESAKVISTAEEEKLQKDVDTTHRELTMLHEQMAPLDRPIAEVRTARRSAFDELNRMSRRLLNMRFSAPYGTHPYGRHESQEERRNDWGELQRPGFISLEEIDSFLDGRRHQITEKETLLNREVSEHQKVEETIRVLKRTGEAGMSELLTKRQAKAQQRLEELQKRKLGIEGLDASNALSALDSVQETLSAVFGAIPENEDRRFSQQRLQELTQSHFEVKQLREQQVNALTRLRADKTHAESHRSAGKIQCPECQFSWIVGFNPEEFNRLSEFIAANEVEIGQTDKRIEQLEQDIQRIRDYSTLYSDYMRCVRNWPVLNPFWEYLNYEQLITRSPRKALVVIEELRKDLGHELTVRQIDQEIAELESLIRDTEKVGDASLTETQVKLNECTLRVESLTRDLTILRREVNDYSSYRRQLAEGVELSRRIEELVKVSYQLNEELVEATRRDTLNHCVRQLQHSLAIKQKTLNDALTQRALVTDIEKNIKELELQEEAAKLVVRELSPTDGLIAEGLFGFIRNFTGQMNSLIRKIWSYPLVVQDCGMSSASGAELDYKFPLMVQTKGNVVADVKLGSSGMQEIVDLAFKVVAMRYLGLSESPLYLDEFGASFDEAHRTNAPTVIKSLMDTQHYTQLFMVSHYESFHGVFTNAEVCVLDKTNITVPGAMRYNQHVVIE